MPNVAAQITMANQGRPVSWAISLVALDPRTTRGDAGPDVAIAPGPIRQVYAEVDEMNEGRKW